MPNLIAIMGTTASGKSALAEGVADKVGAQLLNADAFQVYRGMDIGTAKPFEKGKYCLLDLVDPDEEFGLGTWLSLAVPILLTAFEKDQDIVVVGGSGLYIRALMEEYAEIHDSPSPELRNSLNLRYEVFGLESLTSELVTLNPKLASEIDLKNRVRVQRALEKCLEQKIPKKITIPQFRRLKFATNMEKAVNTQVILERIDAMLECGWLLEITKLQKKGYLPMHPGFRAHGYRHFWQVVAGDMEIDEAKRLTAQDVTRYAKRQRTWLRTEPDLNYLQETEQGRRMEEVLNYIYY